MDPLPDTEKENINAADSSTILKDPKVAALHVSKLTLVLLVLLLGVAGTVALSINQNNATTEIAQSPVIAQQKVNGLGGSITVVEGLVQFSSDGKTWTDATGGESITEGDYVRTQENSRAVLLLDDGSAVRLDSSSTMKLQTSNSETVSILLSKGQVYTRVSDNAARVFNVSTPNDTFQALGTAYKTTVGTGSGDSVEVYQSEVKVLSSDEKIEEGNKYNTVDKLKTEIDLASLDENEFVQWNKQKDLSHETHSKKLGVLTPKVEESKPDPVRDDAPHVTQPTPNASISLSGTESSNGINFTWALNNTASYDGFKLVRSTSDSTPSYGTHKAVYLNKSNRSHHLKLADGKSYHFRICIYRSKTSSCDTYSNSIKITTPYTPPVTIEPGSLTLVKSGSGILWTVAGTAPHGFKVVSSSNHNPTYPHDFPEYHGAEYRATSLPYKELPGTYYVRVCKYTGDTNISGGCTDYSNEISFVVTE